MMNNVLEKFDKIAPIEKDIFTQFEAIMNLPDSQFDKIYDEFNNQIKEIFNSKNFQDQVLNNLAMMPKNTDIEAEKRAMNDFIEEIRSDDSISSNKKNLLITLIEQSVLKTLELYEVPRDRILVKVEKIHPDAIIPTYAHPTDAGADIYAVEDVTIDTETTVIVKTGLRVEIPIGYEIQIRPRSGISAKTGLRIANAPGTIDSNYRGEIGVIISNINSHNPEVIKKGDKIAQMLIAPTPMIKWVEGKVDTNTDRGTGGYGSTDKKEN